ncbi:MAG: hypothetical protein JO287_18875 [Pseudonocardiales bacterium]|nr:hypothetical protein [Pseudonocardiales bacterium]
MLLLTQVTIDDIYRRLGGLFSHRQRNQPKQPSQFVGKDIDMSGVQRRVIIVGQRRVRERSQVHEVIIGEHDRGVSLAVSHALEITGRRGCSAAQ